MPRLYQRRQPRLSSAQAQTKQRVIAVFFSNHPLLFASFIVGCSFFCQAIDRGPVNAQPFCGATLVASLTLQNLCDHPLFDLL